MLTLRAYSRLIHIIIVVSTAIIALGHPCFGAFTGLVQIPTAEVLSPGEYGAELQLDGPLSGLDADVVILNTQFGLSPRFEAGIDLDLSSDADTRVIANGKYLLLTPTERRPALAVGISNIAPRMDAAPYLVASQAFGDTNGHLGALSVDGEKSWFIGLDRPMSDRLLLMADYISGSENYSSVGFEYGVTEHFGVLAGVLFPNEGGDAQFTLHFVWCGSFR